MQLNFQNNSIFDRRVHQRIDVSLPSMVNCQKSMFVKGTISNLSISGARLVTDVCLEDCCNLQVLFKLDFPDKRHHLFCNSKVIRQTSHNEDSSCEDSCYEYALAFEGLSEDANLLLDNFIVKNTPEKIIEKIPEAS